MMRLAGASRAAASAVFVLAVLAAAAQSCTASRLGVTPTMHARIHHRLLQQQAAMVSAATANATARVNASIASSTNATNVTLSDVRLYKCQWDEAGQGCFLNAAYALSGEVPEPSEYGGWVLAGGAALDLLCGAHVTPRTCNSDFLNQCAWDSSARACMFGASNDYTLAQLFLCSDSQGAQAIQCSLYNSSSCTLNPNCTFVSLGMEDEYEEGGDEAAAAREETVCVPSSVAQLQPEEVSAWYRSFSHFEPEVWGSCQQLEYAEELLQCALYGSEDDCGADNDCAWDSEAHECALTADALYDVLAGEGSFGEKFMGGARACMEKTNGDDCKSEVISIDDGRLETARQYMLAAVQPGVNVSSVFNGTSQGRS